MYTGGLGGPMRKSFKDSIKVLEADIQHANTLASDFSGEYDGACLQMRMSYSPAAHIFLFLVQWTDCHLAGALGLLRILIYKVHVDGTTTMSTYERKASIREFYAVIYPSLVQLERGVTDSEDKKQNAVCQERYKRRNDEDYSKAYDPDIEREDECGICMEAFEVTVMPLLPRWLKKGELGGSVGVYGQQRCSRHDNNYKGESKKVVHVYREVTIDHAR
ncbi:E3 ubiquitin-protein ligase AIRP2-like isoform X4 [Solanum pennellii]|uniref:E3 ubiquitin-protein ligase AIRP2-like isoform X4 n=1 Tax=Solanum pennellii TaxID=28526 RepID=A0ABM1HRT0_SOLPN|nr:E3 ubiquitin-protein ligase AIRP2-like isoform X4 [Solanum pennellii]